MAVSVRLGVLLQSRVGYLGEMGWTAVAVVVAVCFVDSIIHKPEVVLCGTVRKGRHCCAAWQIPTPATHLLSVCPCLRQLGGNRETGGRQLGIYGGNTECASRQQQRDRHTDTQ